jgi:YHS domain-containing protein
MQIDPVCGMEVDDKSVPVHDSYKSKSFFFVPRVVRKRL